MNLSFSQPSVTELTNSFNRSIGKVCDMEDHGFKTEDVTVGLFVKTYEGYSEIIAINEETRGSRAVRVAIAAMDDGQPYIRCLSLFASQKPAERRPKTRKEVEDMWDVDISVLFASDLEGKVHSKFGTLEEVANSILQHEVSANHVTSVTRFIDCETSGIPFRGAGEESCMYMPRKEEGSLISLVRSLKDAKRDRRTTMKPGRAFRYMFPSLSDSELARVTERWVETTSPRELTLHVGKDAASFRLAYDHDRADYRNPTTTFTRKSIATSCMQGVNRPIINDIGERVYVSVGEAYASGDFAVAYLTNKDGLIAGRVVYSDVPDRSPTHGPVYGACEQSLDMLEAHLDSIGSGLNVEEWAGLRLVSIGDTEDPIVPYIDGELSCTPGHPDYILLQSYGGSHTFEGTDGYLTGGMTCECCGRGMDDDEAYMTDDGPHCEHCFDAHYVMTDNGEVLPCEDAVYANTKSRWGFNEEWIHTDEAVFCELIDEYWHIDDVVASASGEHYIPAHMVGQFPELFDSEEEEAA
jgi:hypothetical protein